jgi:3-oxoacyl-[acyl-carrier protein] reductase
LLRTMKGSIITGIAPMGEGSAAEPGATWSGPPADEGLKGRTAVITGAGRNIGRAIAIELAQAGANVVVNARQNRDEAEAVVAEVNKGGTGARAIAVIGDIGDSGFDEELIGRAIDEFGGVDCLVNNAGRRPRQAFLDITPGDWDSVLGSNLSSIFYLSRLALPGMVERGWGRIISIGGPDGQQGAPFRAHNVTCKAGMIGLMKAITLEFGPLGVTANVVVPGMMNTTRNPADYPGWPPSQEYVETRVPVGRMGASEEVAYACRFLASNLGAYVSGQTLHVNGGTFMP